MCIQSKIQHWLCTNIQNWKFATIHHNKILNIAVDMLEMVGQDVRKEPIDTGISVAFADGRAHNV